MFKIVIENKPVQIKVNFQDNTGNLDVGEYFVVTELKTI